MMRRIFKKKEKIPKGYDSGLEYTLHKDVFKNWEHHPDKIPYISKHLYEPDFMRITKDGIIYIEVKGRFRDNAEARKYVDVREALTEDEVLIFIFQDADKPMPFAKKRKDGTKYTHREWAEKNGFRYYCAKAGVPKWITWKT